MDNYSPLGIPRYPLTLPADGDPHSGATYQPALQQIGDNVQSVKQLIARTAASIGANQNDYVPHADWPHTGYMRLASSGLYYINGFSITGINGGQGRFDKILYNSGANNIGLAHLAGGQSVGCQISCPYATAQILRPGDFARVIWDAVSLVWRVVHITRLTDVAGGRIYTSDITAPALGEIAASGLIKSNTGFQLALGAVETRLVDHDSVVIVNDPSASGWKWNGAYYVQTGTTIDASLHWNLNKHLPKLAQLTRVRVRVKPATARAGASRMYAYLFSIDRTATSSTTIVGATYDDAGAGEQDITLTPASPVSALTSDTYYRVIVASGNGTAGDRCISTEIQFNYSNLGAH